MTQLHPLRRAVRRRGARWSRLAHGRQRGGWIGLVAGVAGIVVAVAVLMTSLGLIGGGEAASAGVLRVPVGQIAATVVVGYLVSLVLLLVAVATRSTSRTWAAAMLAVGVALAVSVFPVFATAAAAVDQARDVLPWIRGLVDRATG